MGKTRKRKSVKSVVDTHGKKVKSGAAEERIGRDEMVEEEKKMEEFFAILRRYYDALKHFNKNNNSNNNNREAAAELTRRIQSCSSSCPTFFESQDFQVNDEEKSKGAAVPVVEKAPTSKTNLGFDLNAAPAAEDDYCD